MPPSAIITPPRINRGTASMGVKFAPEKVLLSSWVMEPPLSIINMGAAAPATMLIPMGTVAAMAMRNTINTSNAAITHHPHVPRGDQPCA